MRHNKQPSECHDYYCDANNICGQSCAELDIQEGNRYSWHTTLHGKEDPTGMGKGYGGGGAGWSGPRQWSFEEYGPGAGCIDTMKPFQVSAMFPADQDCKLSGIQLTLSQADHACQLHLDIETYGKMDELSEALHAGMTPVVSYWSSDDLGWMDGMGSDGKGPCNMDNATLCGASASFSDFSIEDIVGSSCKASLTSQKPAKRRTKLHHASSAAPVRAETASTTSGDVLIEDQSQGRVGISPFPLALIGFLVGSTATIAVLAVISFARNRRMKQVKTGAPAQGAAGMPNFVRPASSNNLLPGTADEVQEQQETPPEVQPQM